MDSSDSIYSKNFILNNNKTENIKIQSNHKYDFSLVIGKFVVDDHNNFETKLYKEETISKMNSFKKTNDLVVYNNINYHETILNGSDNFKLLKGAICQSSIYHLYNVENTFDFYNYPELLVQNNFAEDGNIVMLEDLTQLVEKYEKEFKEKKFNFSSYNDKKIYFKNFLVIESPSLNVINTNKSSQSYPTTTKIVSFMIGFDLVFSKRKNYDNTYNYDKNIYYNKNNRNNASNDNIPLNDNNVNNQSDKNLSIIKELQMQNKDLNEKINKINEVKENEESIRGFIHSNFKPDEVHLKFFDTSNNLIEHTIVSVDNQFQINNKVILDNSGFNCYYVICSKKEISVNSTAQKYDFFISSLLLEGETIISINPINMIIAEYVKMQSFVDTPNSISNCLYKLGISHHKFDLNDKFIKKICDLIEVYLYTASYYTGNLQEIIIILTKLIVESNSVVELTTTQFIVQYLTALEDVYGIISERSLLYTTLNLFSSLSTLDGFDFLSEIFLVRDKSIKIRESPFTFKYVIDIQEPLLKSFKKTPVDFTIKANSLDNLLFYPNDFMVIWENGVPISRGASSINLYVDPHSKIEIIPESKRAKQYEWLQNETNNHTLNTLLKGVYGELLTATKIIPVQKTIDSTGKEGNGKFRGFITEVTLSRSMNKYTPNFFSIEHDNIIRNLKSYYKKILQNDENVYTTILETSGIRGVFSKGEILKIPIDIMIRYKIQGDSVSNKQPRIVEGIWRLNYLFQIS